MTRLKITTYKSYAYMFRADNQANLPCISSVDSSETFLSREVHISGYVWESTFLYNQINFPPKVLHGIICASFILLSLMVSLKFRAKKIQIFGAYSS